MQKPVPNYPLPTSLNLLKDAVGVSTVDYSAEFDELYKRLNKDLTLLESSFGISIKNKKNKLTLKMAYSRQK